MSASVADLARRTESLCEVFVFCGSIELEWKIWEFAANTIIDRSTLARVSIRLPFPRGISFRGDISCIEAGHLNSPIFASPFFVCPSKLAVAPAGKGRTSFEPHGKSPTNARNLAKTLSYYHMMSTKQRNEIFPTYPQ
jgi:hypothetical protein